MSESAPIPIRELLERPSLRVGEVAKVIPCSRQTVYNLIERGELPSVRVGGMLRIPTRHLVALLEGATGAA